MRVEILGTEYECRRLSGTDRSRWFAWVHNETLRTFYSDLYARVEFLPEPLQVEVFRKESPPARVDLASPVCYRVASTPPAVRHLLELVATDWTAEVTEENADHILTALKPVFSLVPAPTLDTPAKQQAARDTFSRLEVEGDEGYGG